MKHKKASDIFLSVITYVAAGTALLTLVFLIGYITFKGLPNLKWSLFSLNYTSQNVSMLPAIVNTVLLTLLSLLVTVPLGVFTAIYLVEYAKKGNKLVGIVRVTAETLSGIPSIVYGLFGSIFFVVYMKLGLSMLSGVLTVSIMILPLIMRTTEEALKGVPDSYREGSFGLGTGRLRTVFRIVLPAAVPGILSGVILAIGRIVGETAALVFTAGTVAQIPNFYNSATQEFFWQQSTRTLSVHMYNLSSEGLHVGEAYATAFVLIIMVIGVNALAEFAAKKLSKG